MSHHQDIKSEEFGGTKLIFLHHIDDFQCNEIRKKLMEDNFASNCMKYEIFGCLNNQENLVKVMHDKHPVEIFNCANDNYIRKILACDVLVFDVNSNNFEKVCSELRKVMKGLEDFYKEHEKGKMSNEVSKRKYLILISSPMTWALTLSTPDAATNQEEDDSNGFFFEEDYRRRKAHANYCKHKLLERDVIWLQKKCKHFLKTLIVCPGITYGGENDKFHYIFKFAFYNQPIPVVTSGRQLIPMIYIKDFVNIMKHLFDNFPESKIRYVFAVQPSLMTLKSFCYNICKVFNEDCSKIRFLHVVELLMFEAELFPQTVVDVLSLNVKMGLTYFKDFQFHEINEELWCTLAEEFRSARNLHPLKIVIDGPPLVGKTEHATRLSEYYRIPYIDICKIINTYISYLEEKINDSTLALESLEDVLKDESLASKSDEEDLIFKKDLQTKIKNVSKELFDLKVYIASHKEFEDQDFEHLSKCLIALISTKQYSLNQGYVIDSFPFTYDQAKKIFYNELLLRPTHAIIFDAPDELLCKHAMDLTEIDATIRRCLRHQMLPRLDAYRERNEGTQCLAEIFFDNDLIPISITLDNETRVTDTLEIIKKEIGPPFIYPLSSLEKETLNSEITAKRLKEKEEQSRKKEELLKSLTKEREQKLSEWIKNYEMMQEQVDELNDIKSLPLRQYLEKYVLPTLTEGILKVAELKPDDPVDFLAEYLFKCNPEGQQAPPFCTAEQRERFEKSFYEDIGSFDEVFKFESNDE